MAELNKKEVNKSQAIQECSNKKFSNLKTVGEKRYVTLEAKTISQNENLRKDIKMLKLLKSGDTAKQNSTHPGRSRIIDFLEEDCDAGDDQTLAKMTLELIEPFGFDLMCLMIKQSKTQQAMPMSSIAHYLYQVCEGLDYMHKVGLVHGDVKLQNVLVTMTGDIKIIDFGYTCVVGKTGDFPYADYMAPEAAGQTVLADTAIDIFCLGMMIGQLSHVAADGDKTTLLNLYQKACAPENPNQRIKLEDLMKEEWLESRYGTTHSSEAECNHIPKIRMKGYAMLVNKEVAKLGDTIGSAQLMQQGVQVLYVDRRNRRSREGIELIDKCPGPDTQIALNDWLYFGKVEGTCKVFNDAVALAMNPDENVPHIFPVYLSFSEVELPEEVDGYVLGPAIVEGSPGAATIQEEYAKLPVPPKGYLNLRKKCQINLAGVRRDGMLLSFPGPAFMLKAGDVGLFVQAQGEKGDLSETHELETIPQVLRASAEASQAKEKA